MCDKDTETTRQAQAGNNLNEAYNLPRKPYPNIRRELERRLRTLNSEADKIIEVLKDLTPEMEKTLEVNKKLCDLGYY